MKKVIGKTCLFLAAVMVMGTLPAGCGSQPSKPAQEDSTASVAAIEGASKLDISKEVELTMYLLGDPPKDYSLVLDEVNKLMKNDINATLITNWISWGDLQTKYPLVLASGEPFDLIFSADWAFFVEQSQKGAFLPLNDLLPKFAPVSYEELPKDALDQATINGNIFMLPMNCKEVNPHGYVVRGDLRQKYGMPEIKTLDDFGAYLDAVALNEKGIIPYNAGGFDLNMLEASINFSKDWYSDPLSKTLLMFDINDPAYKVFSLYFTPEYEEFAKKMKTWADKGYWSKSVLVNKVNAQDSFLKEKSAALVLNLLNFNQLYMKVKDKYPTWNIEWYSMDQGNTIAVQPYISNGMSVNANSKNPERSLMLLELLRNDKRYFNLTTYGIKGKHYELTADGKITLPAGLDAADNGFPPDAASPWGWRVDKFLKAYANGYPKYNEIRIGLQKQSKVYPLRGFVLNEKTIKSEDAAETNVLQQYAMPVTWGLVDPQKGIEELRQKLKEAGIDKIIRETQKQVDEFLKNNK